MKEIQTLKILDTRTKQLRSELKMLGQKVEEKKRELSIIEDTILALKAGKKPYVKSSILPMQTPSSFSKALKWDEKIIYVLRNKKALTAREISVEIAKLERDRNFNDKKRYSIIQQVLSRMIIKDRIIKIGDYNSKYKLNPIYVA